MAATHAAADSEVVADQLIVLDDGDEAEAVGETSTSFTGGMTKPILNLRGRYVLP
jgi:hypothetical protein